MTIAYWCVLSMVLFPYLFTILAKTGPGFNNRDPRHYLENTTGWRRRAHYVQLNSFEALPAFAIAIIIAHLVHSPQFLINKLAIGFVIARIIYAICYLTDQASLRSLFWLIAWGCTIALFFISLL